jgi:DNA-binding response OmpR family regulator
VTLTERPTSERPATAGELLGDVTPDQAVLLVGPPELWATTGIAARIESAGWTATSAADLDRACWLATIQRLSLVLVAGSPAQVAETVEALRPLTTAPLVVVATASSGAVVALVGAGVDAIVDPERGVEEVFARVVALLRRADHAWAPGVRYLCAGGLHLDLRARECSLDGEPLALSPTEYALLTFLMTHPEEALTTQAIVRQVWGWYTADGKNALRIFVNRVRRKLGDDPRAPAFIASVRGTGYRFIRNVTQLGDDAEPLADTGDLTILLGTLESLALVLRDRTTTRAAADAFLDTLEALGYADGLALFLLEPGAGAGEMRLVSARRMSDRWLASVENGVPLTPTFASAHSVLIGEPVQFGDIRQEAHHFSATARELADSGFRACSFLPIGSGPIGRDEEPWGHLGLARRAPEPFDATASAFLRAACALFALRVHELADR